MWVGGEAHLSELLIEWLVGKPVLCMILYTNTQPTAV